jgi:hypothetical protein
MLTVVGHMHIIEWQRSMSAMDTQQLFLPITKARILNSSGTGEPEFEFVAVNKSRVIAMVEAGNV